jgi:hypothetical protein
MRIYHVHHRIAPDWREGISAFKKLSLRNKNIVGTHFGGGLNNPDRPVFYDDDDEC